MLCLLSPTKTLAEATCPRLLAGTHPENALAGPRAMLLKRCQALKKSDIKSSMKISDALAELNYKRFQGFEAQPVYSAGFLFDGPAFQKLHVKDFTKEQLAKLNHSLCILSGLYGFLRPDEGMQPYRLEMGTKLAVDGVQNLYQFWAKHGLTAAIAAFAKDQQAEIVLNCASQEYSKAVDFDQLRESGLNVVDVTFKAAGGRLASVYGKQARGMMVRFVAKKNPSKIEDLHAFTGDGHFQYNAKVSTSTNLVFERHMKPVGPGDDEAVGMAPISPKPKLKKQSASGDKRKKKKKEEEEEKEENPKRKRRKNGGN